uniref:Uncharacterized protein LOC111117765 n=1 Tax=Crassostrea virginica TaxID=6565 RepID=A0A8B8CAD5_CRAVI|nr:uncharacterized protein LOC111117765 [Crassostrea virginica]
MNRLMSPSLKVLSRRPKSSCTPTRLASQTKFYRNTYGQTMNSNTSVYCMQFDVSDLREHELPNFTTTLHNDVSSMKPDIVYIQQTKHGVQLQELGLRMKGLGYDGYEQTITPELKQATYFRSNLLRGLYGNPTGASQEATTG